MCGIFCSLSRHGYVEPSHTTCERLKARGPDASNVLSVCLSNAPDPPFNTYVTVMSTVLSLRGSTTTLQPYQDGAQGPLLCWNGEAWSIGGSPVSDNDTTSVFALLCGASRDTADSGSNWSNEYLSLTKAVSSIAGPFAFVFYDPQASKVWFARDFLGRRSLLHHVTENGAIILSSVADESIGANWTEVEADGVYCIDLNVESPASNLPSTNARILGSFAIHKYPYCYREDDDADGRMVGENHSSLHVKLIAR